MQWTIIGNSSADAAGELATGGRYNPASDQWTAFPSAVNAPEARQRHGAVWAGSGMLILNGLHSPAELGASTNHNKNYVPPRTYYLFQKN